MQPVVLIVDDEVDFTDVLNLVLQAWGFHTVIAHDGAEAYNIAVTIKPDLILTDSYMPKMSGLALIERLRTDSTASDIPVILMSGMLDTLLTKPVAGVLKKPFHVDELRERICQIPLTPKRRKWLGFTTLKCNLLPSS